MNPPNENRILVIESAAPVRRRLRASLTQNGYLVAEAVTGEQGVDEAIQCQPRAVLLDMELPDMSGLAVLRRLREWCRAPVLAVSASRHPSDKITALDEGANDYITKPFGTGELLARLRAALRFAPPPASVFRCGKLSVDFATRTVRVLKRKVRLTATEFTLLRLFALNAGRVLTHDEILREVWGRDEIEKKGYVRVYLAYLRGKLEKNPSRPEFLVTEPGVGYRLALQE